MVRAARVRAAETSQIVDAIKQNVLNASEYFDEADGSRITEPSKDWTMSDEQSQVYWALCKQAKIAAGFDPEPIREGYCPALVAESELCDHEADLVEAARAIPGCEHIFQNLIILTPSVVDSYGCPNRTRYVDLLLKAID